MRSGDPLKRGFRVDYTGHVVLMDSLDAPGIDGAPSGYVGDCEQFRLWSESLRNEERKTRFYSSDSAVADAAQLAALMCVSREIPQGYPWRIEITTDRAAVVVTTPNAGDVRFSDSSLGLLLFEIERVNWASLRPPEPPPVERQFTPEQKARQDAFERMRAEMLAKRSPVS